MGKIKAIFAAITAIFMLGFLTAALLCLLGGVFGVQITIAGIEITGESRLSNMGLFFGYGFAATVCVGVSIALLTNGDNL